MYQHKRIWSGTGKNTKKIRFLLSLPFYAVSSWTNILRLFENHSKYQLKGRVYPCLLKTLAVVVLEEELGVVLIYGTVSSLRLGNNEFLSLLIFLSIWRAVANAWMNFIVKRFWQTSTELSVRGIWSLHPSSRQKGSLRQLQRGVMAILWVKHSIMQSKGSIFIHIIWIFKICAKWCNNHDNFSQFNQFFYNTALRRAFIFYCIPRDLNIP